jgi:hypothetical protein
MMSWYYAGYYTGLLEGQQKAWAEAGACDETGACDGNKAGTEAAAGHEYEEPGEEVPAETSNQIVSSERG